MTLTQFPYFANLILFPSLVRVCATLRDARIMALLAVIPITTVATINRVSLTFGLRRGNLPCLPLPAVFVFHVQRILD